MTEQPTCPSLTCLQVKNITTCLVHRKKDGNVQLRLWLLFVPCQSWSSPLHSPVLHWGECSADSDDFCSYLFKADHLHLVVQGCIGGNVQLRTTSFPIAILCRDGQLVTLAFLHFFGGNLNACNDALLVAFPLGEGHLPGLKLHPFMAASVPDLRTNGQCIVKTNGQCIVKTNGQCIVKNKSELEANINRNQNHIIYQYKLQLKIIFLAMLVCGSGWVGGGVSKHIIVYWWIPVFCVKCWHHASKQMQ